MKMNFGIKIFWFQIVSSVIAHKILNKNREIALKNFDFYSDASFPGCDMAKMFKNFSQFCFLSTMALRNNKISVF